MPASIDIWKMLAGVAFFLLAMNLMEESLHHLAGRRFKLFLRNHTSNKLKAIGGGAIVTGLLQSSSIVNLFVLGMVGAGVLGMENALSVILGSNLGTTFSSWLVATLGFKVSIDSWALPVAGITGIVMAFVNNENKVYAWLKLFFSLSFLFIALGFIKTGMEGLVKQTDLTAYKSYPVIVYVLLGVLLTTIIQSSSATIALTLSALYTNAITFYIATAIVLGSEIGTTFKLFLASAKGMAAKKRVALGNFLFNFITVLVMFFLLQPANYLIKGIFKISNNLLALAFFQSLINLFSVILFFPFLKIVSRFLMRKFKDKDDESFYISKVPVTDPEISLIALENETKHLISDVIQYSLDTFQLSEQVITNQPAQKNFHNKSISEKYDYIKRLHGEMHSFYLKLQNIIATSTETERQNQLISAIRNTMYAAKSISDAQHDIDQLRNSSNDIKYNFYLQSKERVYSFYQQLTRILYEGDKTNYLEDLTQLYQSTTGGYAINLESFYKESITRKVNETEISTLLNFNRELYTSFKSILFGLKDYLLNVKDAEYFDAQPGFIR